MQRRRMMRQPSFGPFIMGRLREPTQYYSRVARKKGQEPITNGTRRKDELPRQQIRARETPTKTVTKQSHAWSNSNPRGEELPVLLAYLPSMLSSIQTNFSYLTQQKKKSAPCNKQNHYGTGPLSEAPYSASMRRVGSTTHEKEMRVIQNVKQ